MIVRKFFFNHERPHDVCTQGMSMSSWGDAAQHGASHNIVFNSSLPTNRHDVRSFHACTLGREGKNSYNSYDRIDSLKVLMWVWPTLQTRQKKRGHQRQDKEINALTDESEASCMHAIIRGNCQVRFPGVICKHKAMVYCCSKSERLPSSSPL